jgi:hypothetical protein
MLVLVGGSEFRVADFEYHAAHEAFLPAVERNCGIVRQADCRRLLRILDLC